MRWFKRAGVGFGFGLRFWLLFFSCVCLGASAWPAERVWAQEAAVWQQVISGSTVRVEVEKALYERSGSEQFFVRVRIQNLTSGLVYVDLRQPENVIYPNLWKVQDREGRGVVSEKRIFHEGLAGPNLTAFLQAAKDGKLARMLGGGTLEFYVAYQGNARFEIDRAGPGKFVLVSMDGHLFLAANERFEMVALEWPTVPKSQTDVMVAWPVAWRRIPEGATVVTR